MATLQIRLGDLVRDRVTGFTGIATARTEWLNKCVRWQLQPRELKDGKVQPPEVFDEEQCEVVEAEAVPIEKEVPTGGDRDDSIALRRS